MSKITVDRSVLERIVEVLNCTGTSRGTDQYDDEVSAMAEIENIIERQIKALAQPQQEPVAMWTLAKRIVFDYIRMVYDLGYGDARNAKAVPGDCATGYKGRDVEADYGGALLHSLKAIASPPALAQPQQEPVATDWERVARAQNAKLMAMCNEPGGTDKLREVLLAAAPPAHRPLTDDSDRLDWLMRMISGVEFRRIGVYCAGNVNREDIDSAIESAKGIKS